MALIAKKMWLVHDTHESRGWIILPLHRAIVKNIDPIWVELIHHVFVPYILHLPYM